MFIYVKRMSNYIDIFIHGLTLMSSFVLFKPQLFLYNYHSIPFLQIASIHIRLCF